MEHFSQFRFWINPRSDSVAEKYEVLHNSTWIHSYHMAHATESTIFLFIVSDIPQRSTPTYEEKLYWKTSECNTNEARNRMMFQVLKTKTEIMTKNSTVGWVGSPASSKCLTFHTELQIVQKYYVTRLRKRYSYFTNGLVHSL